MTSPLSLCTHFKSCAFQEYKLFILLTSVHVGYFSLENF